MRGSAWVTIAALCSACRSEPISLSAPAPSTSASVVALAASVPLPASAPTANVPRTRVPELTLAEVIPGDDSNAPYRKTSVESVKYDAASDRKFAFELLRALRVSPNRNVALSPTSVRSALGMAFVAARGETLREMSQALGFHGGPDYAAGLLADVVREFAKESQRGGTGSSTRFLNSAWGQAGFRFRRGYLNTLSDRLSAPLATVDFVHAPEAARASINAWADAVSEHQVHELIPPGVVKESTRLVLANAVYFRARWAQRFDANDTHEGAFHAGTGTRQVPLMNLRSQLMLNEVEGVKALRLPYESSEWSMWVLLPNARDGLERFEHTLTAARLEQLSQKSEPKPVRVTLPRFTLGFAERLDAPLQRLGMRAAFSRNADFSGMNGARDLFISALVHQAHIAVDEAGTVASAATAAVVSAKAARPEPEFEFVADHPFLVVVSDSLGRVVFLGRVADPLESAQK